MYMIFPRLERGKLTWNRQLQTLSHDAYLALRNNAKVIEYDQHGDKVLHLTDGNYLKLFRRKRLISSAAWYPYAQRFADNAETLRLRKIPCPEVITIYRIPSIQRDAVLYRPLPGNTLRELVHTMKPMPGLHGLLDNFIVRLHETGIYFRSLHLGNIVLTPDGLLGLIDIADLKARTKPVSQYYRQRNLRQLYRYPQDRAWLQAQDPSVKTEIIP